MEEKSSATAQPVPFSPAVPALGSSRPASRAASLPDLDADMPEMPSASFSEVAHATHWSIPWSDLMMVMFVLFAILFSYQMAERSLKDAFRKEPVPELEPFPARSLFQEPSFDVTEGRNVFEQSRQAILDTELENIDVTLQADQTVKVSVRGPMFFDLGKAELKENTKLFLNRLADVINRSNYEVHIIGHTDNFPVSNVRFPTNWELSSARASAVARHLIDQGGVNPGRFTIIGQSMYRPSVPNTTPENKALNRRVEILITRSEYAGRREGAL